MHAALVHEIYKLGKSEKSQVSSSYFRLITTAGRHMLISNVFRSLITDDRLLKSVLV